MKKIILLVFLIIGCKDKPKETLIPEQSAVRCDCRWHINILDPAPFKRSEKDSIAVVNQNKWDDNHDLNTRFRNFKFPHSPYSDYGEVIYSCRDSFLYLVDVSKRRETFVEEKQVFYGLRYVGQRYLCNSNTLDLCHDTCTYKIENNLLTKAPATCLIGKQVDTLVYNINFIHCNLKLGLSIGSQKRRLAILPNETYIIKDAEVVRLYKKGEKPIKKHGKSK